MTVADHLLVALAACMAALFVALLWPTDHVCQIESCPHRKKGRSTK